MESRWRVCRFGLTEAADRAQLTRYRGDGNPVMPIYGKILHVLGDECPFRPETRMAVKHG